MTAEPNSSSNIKVRLYASNGISDDLGQFDNGYKGEIGEYITRLEENHVSPTDEGEYESG
jgi:hypothetical protein